MIAVARYTVASPMEALSGRFGNCHNAAGDGQTLHNLLDSKGDVKRGLISSSFFFTTSGTSVVPESVLKTPNLEAMDQTGLFMNAI